MDKLNRILKHTLLFLAVFLVVNWIFSSCQNKDEELLLNSGNFLFATTDTEYSRRQTVEVEINNSTDETITIPNECPGEPFDVFRKENNEWVQKNIDQEMDCSHSQDITLAPGQKVTITYKNWNFALFGATGIFRIEFTTNFKGEEKTFTTNEFRVVEEGVFRKLWIGVFYRPIYNGLIFFTSIMPAVSFGLGIILLTLLIRTILLIPNKRMIVQQQKMQEIQPRLESIKQKYKGDQQRIAAETMAIWKEAKVNPMGSCLPILLQFPFLIAIYYVVQNGLNPDSVNLLYSFQSSFNLHSVNIHFLGLDLTTPNRYVLPLVIGGLQFIQMKMTMGRKTAKKGEKKNDIAQATSTMVYVMPVLIAVFTATLPAGVGIYWGTSTLYGILQQAWLMKKGGPKKPDEPTVRVINN